MTQDEKNKPVRLGGLQAHTKDLFNKGLGNVGTCSTAASTAAKEVTLGTTFALVSGATILVTFANGISVANATLAITHTTLDGTTTTENAKDIYYHGAALVADIVVPNTSLLMRYDGTKFNIIGDINTHQSITSKADKVASATTGNLASLTSEGNLADSTYAPSDFAAASHTHGNIQNDGALQTTDVTIANGDKLVVTDASDSSKVARTSISFDGSTTTQALTPKGTFETFLQAHQSKSDIGLGNVTNDAQVKRTEMGSANGVASLDSTGKVPSSQLPSYVDDVIEGYYYNSKFYKESTHETEITPESGKIYVDLATDKTYRWSGSAYTQIKGDLALGETETTAYRGDRGKTAYDHSQSTHARTDATKTESSSTNGNIKINGTETTVYTHPGSGTNPHGTTKSDVGLGNVGNFKAVSTEASQGLTDTEKGNARTNIGAGTYSKPSGGIPKTDLAEAVQTSLGKADTAIQSNPVMTGATGSAAGAAGLVPQPAAGDNVKFLRGDGTWSDDLPRASFVGNTLVFSSGGVFSGSTLLLG